MNTNALKHGCCAVDTHLLSSENLADFKALETTWFNAYSPETPAERHLIAELVNADWLLQRTTQTLLKIETTLYTESPNPLDWSDQQQRTLGRFLRYRTAHTNTVAKCRKATEDHRKARRAEALKTKPATPKTATPEPTWKEHLESMRQKAIALGFKPPEL